jgi:general transcription factor 3C polypeptide 1
VMTMEQRLELQKRIVNISEEGRIPFKDCLVIARELNLSVEQVCF